MTGFENDWLRARLVERIISFYHRRSRLRRQSIKWQWQN